MKHVFLLTVVAFFVVLSFNLNWELVLSLEFSALWEYRLAFVRGLGMTFLITLIAGVLGILAGTLLAIVYQSPVAPIRWIVAAHVEIWRNTPLIVQCFWVHYALPQLTGINTSALQSGLIAISFQASAYFTENVRAGIEAIHRGQWDAAYALGLPAWTRWTRVILPPALRIMIPPMVNLTIGFFRATSVLYILQVSELMTVTSRVANYSHKAIEAVTFAAVIYFVLGYAMSRGTLRLEHVLKRSDR